MWTLYIHFHVTLLFVKWESIIFLSETDWIAVHGSLWAPTGYEHYIIFMLGRFFTNKGRCQCFDHQGSSTIFSNFTWVDNLDIQPPEMQLPTRFKFEWLTEAANWLNNISPLWLRVLIGQTNSPILNQVNDWLAESLWKLDSPIRSQ